MFVYDADPRALSPVALAFMGDAVFELMVRRRLLLGGGMPAHKLHRQSVKKVSAVAQALAYDALLPQLTEREQDILRRGRNANTSRVPKSCSPEQYRKATAIEALFGYLYLSGEAMRLEELFGLIYDTIAREEQVRV